MTSGDLNGGAPRGRSLMVPALMTLVALPILLGLGFWQLERLAWKETLIASINESLGKEPMPLEQPAMMLMVPVGATVVVVALRIGAAPGVSHDEPR